MGEQIKSSTGAVPRCVFNFHSVIPVIPATSLAQLHKHAKEHQLDVLLLPVPSSAEGITLKCESALIPQSCHEAECARLTLYATRSVGDEKNRHSPLKKHGLLKSRSIRSRNLAHMRLDPYAWPVEAVP